MLDFALKRLLKLVVKHSVGKYLQSQPDLNQLDVDLGSGRLELRDALLDCEVLNKDLAQHGWQVCAGFVGSITAQLPCLGASSGGNNTTTNNARAASAIAGLSAFTTWSGLASDSAGSSSIRLDRVLLTLSPLPEGPSTAGAAGSKPAASAAGAAPTGSKSGPGWSQWASNMGVSLEELGVTAATTAGVADAISRIAGSLQSLLQNTRLSATNVTLKIELPLAPCDGDSRRSSGGGSCEDPQVAVITVSLDKLEVSEQQQVAAPAGAGSGKVAAAAAAAAAAVAAGVTQRSGGHTSRDAKSSPGGDAASEVNKGTKLSKAITLEGLYVDLGSGTSINSPKRSAPPTPPLSPRRRRSSSSSSSSQCSDSSSPGSSNQAAAGECDNGCSQSQDRTAAVAGVTASSAFLHGPGSQGISMRIEVDMGWGGAGGPQGVSGSGRQQQQQQVLPTAIGVRVFLGPVAVTLEDAQQACLAAVVHALQGQQPSHKKHKTSGHGGDHYPPAVPSPLPPLPSVASPGPTSPPSAAHTGPPYPLNGWPAAYSGNQLLSAQAAGDSLSSSALQESQTFYDAQSVINSITQSMIASTHSFFDYVYGQGVEDGREGYEASEPDEHLGAGLGLGSPERRRLLPPNSPPLSSPTSGYLSRYAHPVPGPVPPAPQLPQAPAPELRCTLHGECLQVALMYPGSSSCSASSTSATTVGTSAPDASAPPPGKAPSCPLPPPSEPCLMLSLAGVEAEAERPHGCPFKWAGLKFHHVQLLEMLHDSAPSGTSRQGGAAAPSLYSLPHIERQALEFAAVPGRLPQELHSMRPVWQLWPSTGHSHSHPPVYPWPLLVCGDGAKPYQTGDRPCLDLRVELGAVPGNSSSSGARQQRGSAHHPHLRSSFASPEGQYASARNGRAAGNGVGYEDLIGGGGHPVRSARTSSSGGGSAGSGRVAGPGAPHARLDLLPATLWVCPASLGRISAACDHWMARLGITPGADGPAASTVASGSVRAGASVGASEEDRRRRAVQAVIDELHAGQRQPAGGKQQQHQRQQGPHRHSSGGGQLPELEVSVSMPHLCIVTRTPLVRDEQEGADAAGDLPSQGPTPSPIATSAARPQGTSMRGRREIRGLSAYTPPSAAQQNQAPPRASQAPPAPPPVLYAALDIMSKTHHDHVSHRRLPPQQGCPLLRLVTGHHPQALVLRDTATLDIAISRARLALLLPPPPIPSTLPATGAAGRSPHQPTSGRSSGTAATVPGGSAGGGSGLMGLGGGGLTDGAVFFLLDLQAAHGSQPPPSSGHGPAQLPADGRPGPDDVPLGCGVFATLQWDGSQQCDTELVALARQYGESHCRDRWEENEDGEGSFWGSASAGSTPGPGSVAATELQERCRTSSHVFLHVRAPDMRLHLSPRHLELLVCLGEGLAKASKGSKDGSKGDGRGKQRNKSAPPDSSGGPAATGSAMQVTTLLQARVSCIIDDAGGRGSVLADLITPAPNAPAATTSSTDATQQPNSKGCAGFTASVEELCVLSVSGLGGGPGTSLTSASVQGIKLVQVMQPPGGSCSSAPVNVASWRAPSHSSGAQSSNGSRNLGVAACQHQPQQAVGSSAPAPPQTRTARAIAASWAQTPPQHPSYCVLYCPHKPTSRAAAPCIDVLLLQMPPAQQQSQPAGAANAQQHAGQLAAVPPPSTLTSLLIRGVTVCTDHGQLTLDWAAQLASLLQVPAKPGSKEADEGSAAGADSSKVKSPSTTSTDPSLPPSSHLVVTLCDLALRHEPLEYPGPEAAAELTRLLSAAGTGGPGTGRRQGSGPSTLNTMTASSTTLPISSLPPQAGDPLMEGEMPGSPAHWGSDMESVRLDDNPGVVYVNGFAQTNNPASITLAPAPRTAGQGRQAAGQAAAGAGRRGAPPGSGQAATMTGSGGRAGSSPAPAGPLSPVAVAVVVEHVRFETRTPTLPSSSPAASHPTRPVGGQATPVKQQPTSSTQQQHELVLHSLGLHLALASSRGPGWGPGDACDVTATTKLQACGYHCVLHEAALRVRVRQLSGATTQQSNGSNGNRASSHHHHQQQQQQPVPPSTLDIEVANQQLLGILTQDSAALLLQLSAQLGALIAATSAKGSPAAGGDPVPGRTRSPAPTTVVYNPGSPHLTASAHMSASTQGLGANTGGSAAARAQSSATRAGGLEGSNGWYGAKPDTGPSEPLQQGGSNSTTSAGAGPEVIEDFFVPRARVISASRTHRKSKNIQAVAEHGPQAMHQLGASAPSASTSQTCSPRTSTGGSSTTSDSQSSSTCGSSWDTAAASAGVAPKEPRISEDWADFREALADVVTGGSNRGGGGQGAGGGPGSPPEPGGMWYPPIPALGGSSPTTTASLHKAAGNNSITGVPGATASSTPAPPPVKDTAAVAGGGSAATGAAPLLVLHESYMDHQAGSPPGGTFLPPVTLGTSGSTGQRGAHSSAATTSSSQSTAAQSIPDPAPAPSPVPTLRIAFRHVCGLWVLHTTRGGGGVQEGRVEAEIDGLDLVIEEFPQGSVTARRALLSVGTFEVRDCRVQQQPSQQPPSSSSSSAFAQEAGGWARADSGGVGQAWEGGSSQGSGSGALPSPASFGSVNRQHSWSSILPAPSTQQQLQQLPSASMGGRSRAMGVLRSMRLGKGARLAQAAAGLAAAGGLNSKPDSWGKILAYKANSNQPRDSRSRMLVVRVDSVRPAPGLQPEVEELRLKVHVLPLRLRLDQDVVSYLRTFADAVLQPHTASALELLGAVQLAAQGGEAAPVLPFIQMAELAGFSVTIDYRPRRLDLAALREGSLVELLALVPLEGLSLSLKPLRLAGLAGWDSLGASAAREWLGDIARTQAHKFLTGLAPVHSLVRMGSAVGVVASAMGPSGTVGRHLTRGAHVAMEASAGATSMLRRVGHSQLAMQVRNSTASLAVSLLGDAYGLGATVAAGAVEYGRSLGMQLGLSAVDVVPPLQMQPLTAGNQQQEQQQQQQRSSEGSIQAASRLQVLNPEVAAAAAATQGAGGQLHKEQPPAASSAQVLPDSAPSGPQGEPTTRRDPEWHSVVAPSRPASVPVRAKDQVQGHQTACLSKERVPSSSSLSSSSSRGLSVNGLKKAAMGAARSTLKGVKGAVRAATSSSSSAGGADPGSRREGLHHIDRRGSATWGGEEEEQAKGRVSPQEQQLIGDDDSWAEVPGRHKSKTD